MNVAQRWSAALAGWGIPDQIVANAPESPWTFPPELFRSRADAVEAAEALDLTAARALEALADGGTVLDVGVGAGAASRPLWGRASRVTGVDSSPAMLEEFRQASSTAAVESVPVLGRWPDVAAEVGVADVAVCAHVLYNVQDLAPFVGALNEHARRRAVIEITFTHPLAWMNDLWARFHGLERPKGPTADVAEEALRGFGFLIEREEVVRPPRAGGFERREEAVALIRRRLCLTPDRDEEVAEALGDRLIHYHGTWSAGPREQRLVTLWWETTPRT